MPWKMHLTRLISVLIVALLPLSARAGAQKDGLLLGIYEGVAGQKGFVGLQEKYMALADYLSKTLQTRVKVETSQNMANSLANLKKGRYTLFFSKPSNVAAMAMRDYNYQLVAVAKGEFMVNFIVQANSPMKKPEDIRGKTVAMAAGTFMETAGMAELRDRGLAPAAQQIKQTQFQDAVAFMVEQGFAEVGIVSPPVASEWRGKGRPVLFQSRKMPFWSLTASSAVSEADVEKLRSALIALDASEDGKKLLSELGAKGFVAGNRQEYLDTLKWLEKK